MQFSTAINITGDKRLQVDRYLMNGLQKTRKLVQRLQDSGVKMILQSLDYSLYTL